MSQPENKSTPITIEQVENGFIVSNSFHEEMRYPKRHMLRESATYEIAAPRVFQSMAELVEFLANHFTHRAPLVATDPATD